MAALRASIEATKGGGRRRDGRRNGSLDDLPKAELDKRAKQADIPGRSKMTKDELIDALNDAA
jgi:DNA end-binding protein Ku